MNECDRRHKQTALSEQEYLLDLGRSLLFYFPVRQTAEILDDYQEYFFTVEEHGDFTESAPPWGTPKDVLKALLAENPSAKAYCYKWSAFWGFVLLLSLCCLFYSGQGMFLAGVLMPLSLFGFIHGKSRLELEARFPTETSGSKKVLIMQCLLPVLVFLLEAEMQFLIKNGADLPYYIVILPSYAGNLPIGPVIDLEYAFFEWFFLLLMFWMCKRVITHSVQYMPGMVHAMGAALFCMDIRECLHSMDLSIVSMEHLFTHSLLFYGLGLMLALMFVLALTYVRIRYTGGMKKTRGKE